MEDRLNQIKAFGGRVEGYLHVHEAMRRRPENSFNDAVEVVTIKYQS